MKKIPLWVGTPPEQFFCPCCGHEVFDNPCSHVMFAYSAEHRCFSHVADHFKPFIDEVVDNRLHEDGTDENETCCDGIYNFDIEEDLERYPDTHTRLMFQLEYNGMTHGENLSCAFIGIDFAR